MRATIELERKRRRGAVLAREQAAESEVIRAERVLRVGFVLMIVVMSGGGVLGMPVVSAGRVPGRVGERALLREQQQKYATQLQYSACRIAQRHVRAKVTAR